MFYEPTPPPERIQFDDGHLSFELRRSKSEDAAPLVAAIDASLPELRTFMPWAHLPDKVSLTAQQERMEMLHDQWEKGTDYVWNILVITDGAPCFSGCVGLHPRCLNPLGREIGFWVRSDMTGRGLCTAVTKAMVLVCFDAMGLERLQVGCDESNAGSRRVIEKVGFSFEGRLENMLESARPETIEAGWLGTGTMLLYRLLPGDLPQIDWCASTRSHVAW